MSTPLFIRTPFAGNGAGGILGEDLSTYADTDAFTELTDFVAEPTLVEEVAWCAQKFSTLAGELIVGMIDAGYNWRLIGAYTLPAGSSTLFASGRIALDVVLPTGFKLGVRHAVKVLGGGSFATLDIVPLGGVVR